MFVVGGAVFALSVRTRELPPPARAPPFCKRPSAAQFAVRKIGALGNPRGRERTTNRQLIDYIVLRQNPLEVGQETVWCSPNLSAAFRSNRIVAGAEVEGVKFAS